MSITAEESEAPDIERYPPTGMLAAQARSVSSLDKSSAEIVAGMSIQLEAIVFRLLKTAFTAQEFRELRKELYPRYVRLSISLGQFLSAQVAEGYFVILQGGFSLITEAVEKDKLMPWQRGGREEALFNIETLLRAYAVLHELVHFPPPQENRSEDLRLAERFATYSLFATLHLDCLGSALLKPDHIPSSDVLHELLLGLRSSVMAYGSVRQGYELRQKPTQEDYSCVAWDAEDEELSQIASHFGLEAQQQ